MLFQWVPHLILTELLLFATLAAGGQQCETQNRGVSNSANAPSWTAVIAADAAQQLREQAKEIDRLKAELAVRDEQIDILIHNLPSVPDESPDDSGSEDQPPPAGSRWWRLQPEPPGRQSSAALRSRSAKVRSGSGRSVFASKTGERQPPPPGASLKDVDAYTSARSKMFGHQ
jgi:hypothetical protein